MNLEGKAAIVTGGSRGIGRSIAEALVRSGTNVCITARTRDALQVTAADLSSKKGGRVFGQICDVREYGQVQELFQHVSSEFGGLDILVNNAGIGIFAPVEGMTPGDFRAVLETNITGVFYCCHEAIPMMKHRGGGYIVNISSLAGTNAHPQMAAYNASKFGLNGFSEALMQEVRHDGIKVSYIMPGSVNTEFGGDVPNPGKAWQLQPEDIADVVVNLLRQNERSLTSRVEIRPSRPPRR